uniref:PmbA/TldA family metallopeptidase n=1 Tax=Roseovarius halophilus (ex Wu et al. 2025) TaxID=3376060 RepID=UPI00399B2862
MSETLEKLTDALLTAARGAGADAADAMAVSGRAVTIDVRAGELEQAERAEGTDLGLRVLVGRRQACVSASDTSPETLAALAERAVAMCWPSLRLLPRGGRPSWRTAFSGVPIACSRRN